MDKQIVAIIGGTGLYEMAGLREVETIEVETPYGAPSDAVVRARLEQGAHELLFLPRHGRGHRIPPHAINFRANICALKKLGATMVVSISAVGSMREEIAPGDLVVVDQFIDLTKRRASTFFDEGAVAHVSFADPVCPLLAAGLRAAAERATRAAPDLGWGKLHGRGTYVCIEGPQFSTRAESQIYRNWGVHVVGMTNMPEAKLAREAELPYATLALATDYDCWHESEEAVDVAAVVARLKTLVVRAKQVIRELAVAPPDLSGSPARGAIHGAVMTERERIPQATRTRLAWLLG